jgi:uncharacterized membrane protein
VLVVALFAFAWVTRFNGVDVTPSKNVFVLELGALALSAVGGWLGGELVDRLGVGVDNDAHLDAPNSLSGRPARST